MTCLVVGVVGCGMSAHCGHGCHSNWGFFCSIFTMLIKSFLQCEHTFNGVIVGAVSVVAET